MQSTTGARPVTPAMRYSVLGPLRLWRGPVEVDVGTRSLRLITALLLVRPGQPVTLPDLADLLWGGDPPANATEATRGQLEALGQTLELDRSGDTCSLPTDDEALDLLAFRRLVDLARRKVRDGDPAGAVPLYVEALKLWRGRCAADLEPTTSLHPAFVAVNREGSRAAREAADAALAADDPKPVLHELRRAAERDQLDTALQAQLVRLLSADTTPDEDGRRARTATVAAEPGPAGVLRADHARAVRPAQLPAAARWFAARQAELQALSAWLPTNASVAIVAIDGMPGVGKSTLAVQWAHRAAPQFPDGQLFVNLRGFDARGAVVDIDEALTGFLRALGAAHREIPFGEDAKAALYRTMTAGRRLLIVLDNARDAEQVRPLIPGSSGSMVIVTSRNRLVALAVREGAHLLTLDVPSPADARETLRLRLGVDPHTGDTADTADLDAIAAGCGRLPLAMAILAARATAYPTDPLRTVVDQLKAHSGTLDAFSGDEPAWDLRSVCSWSYRLLSADAARLFRLLSAHPGPDFGLPTMASLAGCGPREAMSLVGELTRARLLNEYRPRRYVFHDLIRVYATELSEAADSPADRRAATLRIVDHLRQTAHVANVILNPPMTLTPPPAPLPGVTPETVDGSASAVGWFNAELKVLEATITTVSDDEFQPWTLVAMMLPYLQSLGMYEAWRNLCQVALSAAISAHDTLGEAHMCRMLGGLAALGEFRAAFGYLLRAEALFQELGREFELGFTVTNLGLSHLRQQQPERAMEQYSRALALFTRIGQRRGEAVSRVGLGQCLAMLGRSDEAIAQLESAVDGFRAAGDQASRGSALTVLAKILDGLDRHAESIRHYRAAIEIFTNVLYRVEQAEASYHLSGVYVRIGRPDAAEPLLRRALSVAEEVGLGALALRIRESLERHG